MVTTWHLSRTSRWPSLDGFSPIDGLFVGRVERPSTYDNLIDSDYPELDTDALFDTAPYE
jgi:hypothetical protein